MFGNREIPSANWPAWQKPCGAVGGDSPEILVATVSAEDGEHRMVGKSLLPLGINQSALDVFLPGGGIAGEALDQASGTPHDAVSLEERHVLQIVSGGPTTSIIGAANVLLANFVITLELQLQFLL